MTHKQMGGQRVGSLTKTFIPPFNKRALFAVLDAPARQCRNQLRKMTKKVKSSLPWTQVVFLLNNHTRGKFGALANALIDKTTISSSLHQKSKKAHRHSSNTIAFTLRWQLKILMHVFSNQRLQLQLYFHYSCSDGQRTGSGGKFWSRLRMDWY